MSIDTPWLTRARVVLRARPRSGDAGSGPHRSGLRAHSGAAAAAIALAQCVAGSTLLLDPRRVAAASAAARQAAPAAWVVRLLGARLLGQAAAGLARPSAVTSVVGAGIDAAHAASMVAVAGAGARYRRPALISAVVAGASTVAQLRTAYLQAARMRATPLQADRAAAR